MLPLFRKCGGLRFTALVDTFMGFACLSGGVLNTQAVITKLKYSPMSGGDHYRYHDHSPTYAGLVTSHDVIGSALECFT